MDRGECPGVYVVFPATRHTVEVDRSQWKGVRESCGFVARWGRLWLKPKILHSETMEGQTRLVHRL